MLDLAESAEEVALVVLGSEMEDQQTHHSGAKDLEGMGPNDQAANSLAEDMEYRDGSVQLHMGSHLR